MVERRERHGDIFSSHFPFFGRVVYVTDPELIKQVFTGSPAVFHAGEANATALGDALGENSLLTLDEGRHLSQRKLLLPPFHGESVRRYTEVMADAAAREVVDLAAWESRSRCARACRRSRSTSSCAPSSACATASAWTCSASASRRSASSAIRSTGCPSCSATSAGSRPPRASARRSPRSTS